MIGFESTSDWMRSIILALIATAPGVYALIRRGRAIDARADQIATKATIDQFNVLYNESRKQITECRSYCQSLEEKSKALKLELDESLKREDVLEEKVRVLENKVRNLEGENAHLDRVVRRLGGDA